MKIRLTFKTPDALEDALNSHFLTDENKEFSDEQWELRCKVEDMLGKFIKHGEHILVELDVESGQMTVLPQ